MPMDGAGPGAPPSRRRALGLGAGVLASISLSACGIRFEGVTGPARTPAREPVPGEAFVVALWSHTEDLAARAASAGGASTGLPGRLAALHRTQATVLRAELRRLGVPESELAHARATDEPGGSRGGTATGTPTTGGSGSPTRGATMTPGATTTPGTSTAPRPGTVGRGPAGSADLAAAEASDLGPTAISSLSRVLAGAVPLVGSVLAQRSAAATLLGHPATWPEAQWKGQSLAATFLSTTRAAVYAFQVVAAQSPSGAQRTLATSTLSVLQARAAMQEAMAGSSAGPADLAYPLPYPVTTPAAARRLAVDVLTRLRAAGARDLGTAGTDTAALGLLVRWLGETEVLASRWGVPLAPFPGLS